MFPVSNNQDADGRFKCHSNNIKLLQRIIPIKSDYLNNYSDSSLQMKSILENISAQLVDFK